MQFPTKATVVPSYRRWHASYLFTEKPPQQLYEEETRVWKNHQRTAVRSSNLWVLPQPCRRLHDNMVTEYREKGGTGCFFINHSANYREKAKIARQVVADEGQLGRIQHISAFFASPLMEIFDDPEMKGWNEPNDNSDNKMIGNGFAWGQMAHMLGYLFHVCPDLEPEQVFCQMSHSAKTGADIAHSATIMCREATCDVGSNLLLQAQIRESQAHDSKETVPDIDALYDRIATRKMWLCPCRGQHWFRVEKQNVSANKPDCRFMGTKAPYSTLEMIVKKIPAIWNSVVSRRVGRLSIRQGTAFILKIQNKMETDPRVYRALFPHVLAKSTTMVLVAYSD